MATCKNCGKPLIISGGKCIYCGKSPYDIPKKEHPKLSIKKTIDIVICVDCSWPMSPVLDSVKDNIVYLLEDINEYNKDAKPVADWRARIIGYRNFEEDNEYLLNDNPFVTTIEEVKSQLSNIVCKGYSENSPKSSSLDALWYATKTSNWRYKESTHNEELGDPGGGFPFFVVLFTASLPLPVNIKTLVDIYGADSDPSVLMGEMAVGRILLTLFGPDNLVYKELRQAPGSIINMFKDPIEFYYHKQLDFSSIINSFDGYIS